MNEPKYSGIVQTNSFDNSIARIQHSEPSITLMGRVAGGKMGYIGVIGPGRKPDLHFALIISDAYSGIFGFDGQPTSDINFSIKNPKRTLDNAKLIKTGFYRNTLPSDVVFQLEIDPPTGMSKSVFAQNLVQKAYNFSSYVLDYSIPKNLVGSTMVEGEFNSSSYVAGLLKSVMGYVPKLYIQEYQTPGWDSPIPSSYYKGEAIR
jgi:hypothetical protein